MIFHPIYHRLVIAAVFCHLVAAYLTWYALTNLGLKECNPATSAAFGAQGFIIPNLIGTLLLIAVLYLTPILMREPEKAKAFPIAVLFIAVLLMALDAYHDLFILTKNPLVDYTDLVIRWLFDLARIKMVC